MTNSLVLSFGNLRRLFNVIIPPSVEGMEQVCQEGYQDTLRFLLDSRHIHCRSCSKEPASGCGACRETQEAAGGSHLPLAVRRVFQEARGEQPRAGGWLQWLLEPIEVTVDPFFDF